MKTLNHPLETQFTFAGFNFPKWHWGLPPRSLERRIDHYRNPVTGGGYHIAPTPIKPGQECSFYFESDFCPALRWRYCDEVNSRIDHTGWFCDEYGDSKIRGIVGRLAKGRGFVAGWTMGEGMASGMDCSIWDDEKDAANAANDMAERVAETEREYQEEQEEQEEQELEAI